MKLMTIRSQILKALDTWYNSSLDIKESEYGKEILKKLEAINLAKATEEDIAKIVGYLLPAYIRPQTCSECNSTSDILVEIGEPLDYDSCTAFICEDCLQKALELIRNKS